MPLKPGATLRHRYRIESVLGQGGMGAVYKAVDINLGVPVAVKENLFTTDEYARQFRREATILASLRHPNLPRVTDHFVVEGEGQYLVMDFIQGEDVRQRLERDGPIPESEALPWFLETCDALSYLHGRQPQIVHRDIKPGNIKITPEGRPMLVDFGLAKIASDTSSTTRGARAMTPGFSPPEQYGMGRTDGRTDIYSLGATIYAALTASIPEDALERALQRAELTPLRKRNPNVSPALARAVEMALAVRPEDRYSTAADFGAALSATVTPSRPTLPRAYPYLERTKISPPRPEALAEPDVVLVPHEPARRRGPMIAIGVATGLLILAGAAFGLSDRLGWLGRTTPPPPSLGVTPPFAASTNTGIAAIPAGLATSPPRTAIPVAVSPVVPPATPAATPIGGGVGQVAFASSRSGLPQIYLVNVDGTGESQLTTLPDGACQPAWSPDGLQLAFTSPCRKNQESYAGSGLYVMKADGSAVQPLPPRTGGGDYDPAWSPDGRRLAYASLRENNRVQLRVMGLDGSSVDDLTPPEGVDSQPAWSPLGTQLVFRAKRLKEAQIWITTDTTGSEERFSRGGGENESHPDWSRDGQWLVWDRNVDGVSRLIAAPYNEDARADRQVCPGGQLSVQPMAEPRWSPDGQWLVFETWPSGTDHNIAILTSSCTNYTLLTTDPSVDFDPAWRP